jgi:hypothetical protein
MFSKARGVGENGCGRKTTGRGLDYARVTRSSRLPNRRADRQERKDGWR